MGTDKIIQISIQIIAIQSVAGNSKALQQAINLIAKQLDRPGITIERFKHNGKPSLLAYYGSTRPRRFRVLLNGHVDVVSGTPDQFIPYARTAKLYGRGALDMKTAAVTLTALFCELAPTLPYPLGLQIVADEEVGGNDGTRYQIEEGVASDIVIAGEFTPTGAICNQSRGFCWVEASFNGTSGHGAYVWDGDNALLQAHTFIGKLLARYPIPHNEQWKSTVNVASISTPNDAFNRIPDQALVRLDIRHVPGDPDFVDQASAEAMLASLDRRASFNFISFEPAHYAAPDHPDIRQLAAALKAETDIPATFIRKPGAADVRYYTQQGSQAVVFGLQGSGQHGDNEFVILRSIETYQAVIRRFLNSLN